MRFPAVLTLLCTSVVAAQSSVEPAADTADRPAQLRPTPGAPAGSAAALYYQAREQLNQGHYGEAADLFGQVADHYSAEGAAADALYWQAFALYRLGTPTELQKAGRILEEQRRQLDAAEKRTRVQMDERYRASQVASQDQIRQSQENLEKQRRDSRLHFDKQREEVAAAFEKQRQERAHIQENRQASMAQYLAQLEEDNRKSMAELDERRKQTLASYEEGSQRIRKDYEDQQASNRHSRTTLAALEHQREFSLEALEEQRKQSQMQLEIQRQQFQEAFERQRAQMQSALQEQQNSLLQSQTAGVEQGKRILEEIERRNRQQLQALDENRKYLQQQFEEQSQSSRNAHSEHLRVIGGRFAEQRAQSLALSQRIAGDLAQAGDVAATRTLRSSFNSTTPCADEAQTAARLESMTALSKMDPDAVRPTLQTILERNSGCSKSTRERAVFLLGVQNDEPAARMLIHVARVEPEKDLRRLALISLRRNSALGKTSADLVRLYAELEDTQLRQQLIVLYGRCDTPVATRKLIAILREEDNPALRQQSIAVLGGAQDPRVQQALKDAGGRE